MSNLIRYEKDLDELIKLGEKLRFLMEIECNSKIKSKIKKDVELKNLYEKMGRFKDNYQHWYSESLGIIKLLLPERLNDFVKLYEKSKGRKDITIENYVIEDYLRGIEVKKMGELIAGPSAAMSCIKQQVHIVESLKRRFQSSLLDLKAVLQADLFDSELEAAKELNKKGFTRGAGAMAGVVLEHHLSQVCARHNISMNKTPTISDYNDALKKNGVVEIHNWRHIQLLADLRNLCDHKKHKEPTMPQIEELISGVDKITKTIF